MAEALAVSVALLVHTFVLFPLAVLVRAAVRPREGSAAGVTPDALPSVSVILVVRDEEDRVRGRIRDLLAQNYPKELLEIVVASDGSVDGTEAAVLEFTVGEPVRLVACPRSGKAMAINRAVSEARGDVFVFADARQRFERDAIRHLVRHLDGITRAVSGRLTLLSQAEGGGTGTADYWRLESRLRRAEARTGSVIGVTGAIYAASRASYPRIPEGTLLDDLFVPMKLVMDGHRVGYASDAIAYDEDSPSLAIEFRRKVRTLAGNYQLLRLLPGLLDPRKNPMLLRYVSHKLLRLASPALLLVVFASSAFVEQYRLFFLAQVVFYLLGSIGLVAPRLRRTRLVRVPAMILVFNSAAAVAVWKWITGGVGSVWANPRVRRPPGRGV